jgi:hypothetical protein
MNNEKITFTKDGIKVTEKVSNPLMIKERETIIPYAEITNKNPLDIHVVAINPKFSNGTLTEIELIILKGEDIQLSSDYHDINWYEEKVMQLLSDGKEWSRKSIFNKLKEEFGQDDTRKTRRGKSRGSFLLNSALVKLKKENKLENPRRGVWKLK